MSNPASDTAFYTTREFARELDVADPLRHARDLFCIPPGADGSPVRYFCGNSLGLMPKAARPRIEQELNDWSSLAVNAHFDGATPWYSYHEVFRDTGARLVGARPGEVVMMNSLTVNLHLLLISFFRPTPERNAILMEWPAFPSDLYAIQTHLESRGLDPETCIVKAAPRNGETTLRTEDIEALLEKEGHRIAVMLLGGVNYFSGQWLDMKRLTTAGHRHGCLVGYDLAHAAGNVPLQLHDWDVDFAAWCSYKYLNSGPGGIAGCFVHERHAQDIQRTRLGGWWGNDPETRFRMHLEERFIPKADADGWQISNPPILAMAPLVESLAIFDDIGMPALRDKSLRLTGYLRRLLDRSPREWFTIITPEADDDHGCQLSIVVHDDPKRRFAALEAAGVIVDFRPPNVIRAAPVPLYNTFEDAWVFAQALAAQADQ